ncbi:MAG TPA: CoA-binding protein [Cryomorphaceae bacterium]|nr:CoA-binding protein [Cryomorphaceae bacterium]
METKKTVVVGASPNPSRYAYIAIERLLDNDYPVHAEGLRKGEVHGVPINTERVNVPDVHTVTLYVGPRNQEYWKDYIKSLSPKRVIFNPGTENAEFERELEEMGIETHRGCTLVMLSAGTY